MSALISQELDVLEQLRVARAREGLLNFICYTKADYEISWHHRLIAKTLNRVMTGEINRLIITMPPRHAKSENVSVRLPAYALGRNPNRQVICATYNADFAKKINRDVQRVVVSAEYKKLFPNSSMNEKNVRTIAGAPIRNSDMFEMLPPYTGFYKSTSIGGPLTGFGSDLLICDDFCKNYDQARSATYQESVWSWWTTTFTTRALPNASIVVCATRWSENDLIAKILEHSKSPNAPKWHLLNLPAICEEPKSLDDPRQIGEALWPARYDLNWLQAKRAESERTFISMYQQRPAPQEGNIIRSSWWRYWTELPPDLDLLIASADLTYSDESGDEDFTVITVWGRSGPNCYLLDMVRNRMGWLQQKRALLRVVNDYPDLNAIYIENKALGAALIAEARRIIPGVVAVNPKGGKATRLEAVSGMIEAGNVYLPHPEKTGLKFAELVVAECGVFPNGKNDDIVDSLSQALAKLRSQTSGFAFSEDLYVPKESALAGLREV